MPRLRTREISATRARCRRCGRVCLITIRESQYIRPWRSLLARDFDPGTLRTATCAGCGVTHPVRRSDVSPQPAARRRGEDDDPRGRDWCYPSGRDEREPVDIRLR